jgi:hypothetical protein
LLTKEDERALSMGISISTSSRRLPRDTILHREIRRWNANIASIRGVFDDVAMINVGLRRANASRQIILRPDCRELSFWICDASSFTVAARAVMRDFSPAIVFCSSST